MVELLLSSLLLASAPLDRCAPPPEPSHEGAIALDWYVQSEPIEFNWIKYRKYGLPRVLTATEVVWLTPYKGGYIFRDKISNLEVLYVLVRAEGCEFQPYIKDQ